MNNLYNRNEIKEKRKSIALTWLKEKINITYGIGQNDWVQLEQNQMIKLNCAFGYVGNYVFANKTQVQLLSFKDYLSSHIGVNSNKQYGYFNTNTKIYQLISNNFVIPLLQLTNKPYLNYSKEHREMFLGQTDKYGVKIGLSTIKKNKKKNKYGVQS